MRNEHGLSAMVAVVHYGNGALMLRGVGLMVWSAGEQGSLLANKVAEW